MNREEALKNGYKVHPINPNKKRRARWHNYRHPGFYMLTMVTAERKPLFGKLVTEPEPHIALSPLGIAISETEIMKITLYYPNVKVKKLCIMPDHLHLIVHVDGWFPEGKHLGSVVSGFKTGCNKAWRSMMGEIVTQSQTAQNSKSGLFEEGYNDRLLFQGLQMERWYHYLDDNPRRMALKRQNQQFFTVIHNLSIGDRNCQIVGNQFLMDIPDKVSVVYHRRYSDAEYSKLANEWLACAERGGVLVSAAIHPKEKEVMREAMNRGYAIILVRDNGFAPLYKPAGESFYACAEGRLLQISPYPYSNRKQQITRAQCLDMNTLAETLARP